jgi:hypothetical protein
MRIKPNKSIVEGRISRIERAADGIGAEVEIEVERSNSAEGHEDFIGARPGTTVKMFAAVPEELETGRRYKLTASVLGGPGGERVVVESARRAPARAKTKPD